MEYNFWADLFDTYQSTADWIKALWIVAVPGFLLGLTGIILHYRLESGRAAGMGVGDLVYTVHRDADGFRVYRRKEDSSEDTALVLPGGNQTDHPVPMLKNAVGENQDSSASTRGARDAPLG